MGSSDRKIHGPWAQLRVRWCRSTEMGSAMAGFRKVAGKRLDRRARPIRVELHGFTNGQTRAERSSLIAIASGLLCVEESKGAGRGSGHLNWANRSDQSWAMLSSTPDRITARR